ncbi:unnamed protein product [Amoebophrya sp. A25]|nr:unnamed protein product [Amoebophrya sp. A25]|eukprot:GSA25T00008319001.1
MRAFFGGGEDGNQKRPPSMGENDSAGVDLDGDLPAEYDAANSPVNAGRKQVLLLDQSGSVKEVGDDERASSSSNSVNKEANDPSSDDLCVESVSVSSVVSGERLPSYKIASNSTRKHKNSIVSSASASTAASSPSPPMVRNLLDDGEFQPMGAVSPSKSKANARRDGSTTSTASASTSKAAPRSRTASGIESELLVDGSSIQAAALIEATGNTTTRSSSTSTASSCLIEQDDIGEEGIPDEGTNSHIPQSEHHVTSLAFDDEMANFDGEYDEEDQYEGDFSEWRFELANSGLSQEQPELLGKMMDFLERVQSENRDLRKDRQQQMTRVNNLLSSASDTLCKQVNDFLAEKEIELEQKVKQNLLEEASERIVSPNKNNFLLTPSKSTGAKTSVLAGFGGSSASTSSIAAPLLSAPAPEASTSVGTSSSTEQSTAETSKDIKGSPPPPRTGLTGRAISACAFLRWLVKAIFYLVALECVAFTWSFFTFQLAFFKNTSDIRRIVTDSCRSLVGKDELLQSSHGAMSFMEFLTTPSHLTSAPVVAYDSTGSLVEPMAIDEEAFRKEQARRAQQEAAFESIEDGKTSSSPEVQQTLQTLTDNAKQCEGAIAKCADELLSYKSEYQRMLNEYNRAVGEYKKSEQSLAMLRMFVTRRGPVLEDPQNCWAQTFTPEICCSPCCVLLLKVMTLKLKLLLLMLALKLYGPTGHPGCWDGYVTYEKCCALYRTTDTTSRHGAHAKKALPHGGR